MSQWGAYGAARSGLKYQQILAHYYRGAKLSKLPKRTDIRVHVRSDADDQTEVLPERGLRVTVASGGVVLPRVLAGAKVQRWRVIRHGGRVAVQGLAGGRWRHLAVGGKRYPRGPATFTSADRRLRLVLGSVRREYRGAVQALPVGDWPGLATVVVSRLESYLRSVVPSEMPASWNQQAVRAQAVAARTYAAFERETNAGRWHDTCDTVSCQVFNGVADYGPRGGLIERYEHPGGNRAVAATARWVLTHGGGPAFTQFSSANGGWTVRGSRPYLRAFADRYDGVVPSQAHLWSATVSAASLEQAYPSIGTLQALRAVERDGNGPWGGRVEQVVLDGSAGSVTLDGADFRYVAGLRSTWWRLR